MIYRLNYPHPSLCRPPLKFRITTDTSNKDIELLSLQSHIHKKNSNDQIEMINVGFPISALAWAFRFHENMNIAEYLAVGVCSIDFSEGGDELSELTRKSLNMNYLHMSNDNLPTEKSNGHILIYKMNFNQITHQFDPIHLCEFFLFLILIFSQ